jgi:hypothetical protein
MRVAQTFQFLQYINIDVPVDDILHRISPDHLQPLAVQNNIPDIHNTLQNVRYRFAPFSPHLPQ